MRYRFALLAAATFAFAAPALAGPVEDFQKLQDDYWATLLKNAPTLATSVGVTKYDRELGEIRLAAADRQAAEAAAFLKRLERDPGGLAAARRASQLRDPQGQSRRCHRGQYVRPAANLLFDPRQLPWRDRRDGRAADRSGPMPIMTITSRGLPSCPDRMRDYGAISVKAANEGFVQPCVTMTKFADTITGVIAADPAKSRFYAPFAGTRPSSVSAAQWADLQARAQGADQRQDQPVLPSVRGDLRPRPQGPVQPKRVDLGAAEWRGLLCVPGAPADHHQADPRRDPPARP